MSCQLRPERIKSGMAVGFDTMLARIAVKHSIPFDAYVPCENQDRLWPEEARREYRELLKKAATVRMIRTGPYSALKMKLRDEALVDDCDTLLACFDGSAGGTAGTVAYALSVQRVIYRLNPRTLELDVWGQQS